MFGKNVNDKKETEDDMESQWVFPKREPTDLQKRMISWESRRNRTEDCF